MAEPGPGPALSTSFSQTPTPNHDTSPLPRIRFPNQFLAPSPHGESSHSSIGSPGPPILPMKDFVDGNVRPLSKDVTPGILPEISPKRYSSRSVELRRRSKRMSQSRGLSALKDPFVAEFEPSAFSDEYDLYPKILQDVQRALELQSRRRDRKSFTPSQPTVVEGQTLSEPKQDTSFQQSPPASTPSFTRPSRPPLDIDFSPSVQAVPLHPVPLSSNAGATLDWTGSQSEEERLERRWSLGKRKGKDRASLSNKAVLEKQDTLFADRISRIRSKTKQPTFRKAAIVSDQLGRRYNLVYNSISNEDPINLAKATRWYVDSDPGAQAWLDSAEPLTWLKHLLDKNGSKRSKWHLSALIVEEYIKSNRIDSTLPIIRDDSTSARGGSFPSDVSLILPSYPFHSIRSSPSLHHSFGDSLRRIRSSDGQLSFEPRIDSVRSSIDGDYRRANEKNRGLRHVIPALVDAHSIASTTSPYRHQSSPGGLSPASSRHLPFAQRIRRRQVESDEGSSSIIHSQSDDYSGSFAGVTGHRRKRRDRRQPHAPSSYLPSPRESGTETNAPDKTSAVHEATSAPVEDPLPSELASERGIELPRDKPESELSVIPPQAITRQRLIHRMSLPIPDVAKRPERKQREEAEEEELEHEYEKKLQTLDELKAQNHRVRQKLQKIAAEVREYDNLQARMANTHGIPHRGLPVELLEAFNQDPSSVTGGTRERKGWRAVEDVHTRILRQQHIFKMYLSVAEEDVVPDSLLDEPISSLMDTLGQLEYKREALTHKQLEVASALAKVKSLHTRVKNGHNNALSRTSVAYPELSQIIALEESYKDPYQHIWEFGMDALTFILDNVAPVWRNYGRTIGEDIKDFLIIPWYRNEFTGEPKRYDITSFPRRSVRHWFAFFFLFLCTFAITYLQTRAAIFCTFMYWHPWIDNSGFRWLIMPCIWIAFLIHWSAVLFEVVIIILELRVVTWWLGWSVGLFT
ncbi:uncharacterized protein BJ212DRAFT_1482736 [Suillus subaureus]|uniref:Uncharacterized protein n=1 Tax=Suillus subaureus TaxID=48587 RepID=A0A9P7JBS5_9AGAM|nr:uncharacterized protein BJ212DRAFT_1482736 [Suillus subaureus]KAG1813279.1 hypothetical protein BJ212DRAFT_1482736 [Suillus subaureus]